MRQKRSIQTPVLDQNYINSIYQKIVEKIQILDKLKVQYKNKQEGHFLKTFMNVLEKMGNDLIFAQEAYKNVDLEAKKDQYCVSLAEQLHFFKNQCFNLRELYNQAQQKLRVQRLSRETLNLQFDYIRSNHEKKIKQCLKLKDQIKDLKKKLKFYSDPEKNKIFKFTNPLEDLSTHKTINLANFLEGGSIEYSKKIESIRLPRTSNNKQRKNNSATLDKQRPFTRDQNTAMTIGFLSNNSRHKNKFNSTNTSLRNKSNPKNHILPQQYRPYID